MARKRKSTKLRKLRVTRVDTVTVYGNGITRVDIPRAAYDGMLRMLSGVRDAGAFPYQGGPPTEVAIPRWLLPWLNKFAMGPG